MREPVTFLFIGPDKSGSTWIHQFLRAHDQVHVPSSKDIYFFDRNFAKGVDWYRRRIGQTTKAVVGEVSHDYLFSEDAAKRIRDVVPGVKLIACLREPVSRAESHCLFLVRSGLAKGSLDEVAEANPSVFTNGLYAKHLRIYFDLFDEAQILLLNFSELRRDPSSFAAKITEFLGIENVCGDLPPPALPAAKPRNWLLARFAKFLAIVIRQLGFLRLLGALKSSAFLQKLLYSTYGSSRPQFSPGLRNAFGELYAEDARLLNELTSFDVESWGEDG